MGRIPEFVDAYLHIEFTSKMRGMSYQKGTRGIEQAYTGKGSGKKESPTVSKHGNLLELHMEGLQATSLSGSLGSISRWGSSTSKNGSQVTLLQPGEYWPEPFMEKGATTGKQTPVCTGKR